MLHLMPNCFRDYFSSAPMRMMKPFLGMPFPWYPQQSFQNDDQMDGLLPIKDNAPDISWYFGDGSSVFINFCHWPKSHPNKNHLWATHIASSAGSRGYNPLTLKKVSNARKMTKERGYTTVGKETVTSRITSISLFHLNPTS